MEQNPQFPPPQQPQWNQPYNPGGYQPYNQAPFGMQTDAPGATTSQICGIIGIILFFNVIGIILNIIAIVNGAKAMAEFNNYPGRYTESSFRKAKAGRTCGIVGLCFFGGLILIIIVAVAANA